MPLLPVPAPQLILTADALDALEARVGASVSTVFRSCACCGEAALGLEPAASQYRVCPQHPGTNDRALTLSPIVAQLAQAEPDAHGNPCV